jgi:tetratricopeptide (TPR) repeat protein
MRSDRRRQRIASHVAHGEYRSALATPDAWRAREPDLLETELLHARIDLGRGRLRAATERAVPAIRTRDCPPALAFEVVQCLRLLVEHDALIDWAAAWPRRHELPPADAARIAAALETVGAHALASEWIESAVACAPDDATVRVNRALVRSYGGDFVGAREDAERAIASPADPAIAHWMLARLARARPDNHLVEQLRERLHGASDDDAEFLQFALFKQLDDLGDADAAWQALDAGCQLVRARLQYDRVASERLFATLQRRFPLHAPFAAVRSDEPLPIFIVGMHRSGSTLLESMLAAHPRTYSYGESQRLSGALRHAADHPCPALVDEAIVDAAASLDWDLVRDRFLDTGRRLFGDARQVTEKMPGTFQLIGFIRHALPDAKIVHLRRDPMDLCFANLRELFADGVAHAYSQDDLAHYHALYLDLMRHWHAVYPGFVLDVDYEDLVRDPSATSRRVYEFCGLDWSSRVVDPQAWAARPINTLSSFQARQPVNTASIGRWKRYATQLQPLRAALGAAAIA